MKPKSKKEIVFFYESRQNPNGDPGFENQPRMMPDGNRIMVTDVRIKRTIREHAKRHHGKTIFVDYAETDEEGSKKGNPLQADQRAMEIVKTAKKNGDSDVKSWAGKVKGKFTEDSAPTKVLLSRTFDAPLFGMLVPIRPDGQYKDKKGPTSLQVRGACQFSTAHSVNRVTVVNPTISGRFVGAGPGEGEKGHSTLGKFYSVDYALIRCQASLDPENLSEWTDEKSVKANFDAAEGILLDCLWNGTNRLITRSKYPQRSVLVLEVEYKDQLYNDLGTLVKAVDEQEDKGEHATDLEHVRFDFGPAVRVLASRKGHIESVRARAVEGVGGFDEFVGSLKSSGIPVKDIDGGELVPRGPDGA